MTQPRSIELLEDGLRVGQEHIDTLAPGAAQRLREVCGPVISVHVFPGVGNAAELLATGLILLVGQGADTLESMTACFDARDASPYPAFPEVPVFSGGLRLGTTQFWGAEEESALIRLPGASGIAGLVELYSGSLRIGLHTKKRRGRFGKRTGRRRLVLLDASWGGVKPFPPRPPRPTRVARPEQES